MNHASWQTKAAKDRRVTNQPNVFNPEETPDLTKRLLALDEAQLDKLTGKRTDIFTGASRQQQLEDGVNTLEGATHPGSASKTHDSRNRKVTQSGAQSALARAHADIPQSLTGVSPNKISIVHEPAR